MKNHSRLILVLGFTGLALVLKGNPTDTFRLANEAHEKGAVDDAIRLYENLVEHGYGSSDLYYNLGTSYSTKEQWSKARLYLERARLRDPSSTPIEHNLRFVQDKVGDHYAFPRYPLSHTVEKMSAIVGSNGIPMLFFLCFLGLCSCLIYLKQVPSTVWGRRSLLISGVALLCTVPLLLGQIALERQQASMVVLMTDGHLSAIPEEGSDAVEQLAAGVKLSVTEDYGNWLKVDMANGSQGWIHRDMINPIVEKRG
ncbi:MAG: hypothetical protein KTR24_02090 [Saprospiraceae bacterium]|nr:hypothetical protein [Saprospiraceae bacterium]